MKRYLVVSLLAVLLVGLVFLLFWAVRLRQSIPLANHYHMYFDASGPVIILNTNANGLVRARVHRIIQRNGVWTVGPRVDGYRTYKQVIIGHVSKIPGDSPHFSLARDPKECAPGYFVIDAHNDRIYNGLNKQDWLKKMRSFGIDYEPELVRPTIWHRLTHNRTP